jgi:hypothetical protein
MSGQFVQPLLSRTITLYASYMKTFNWEQENTFSISFPVELYTRGRVAKLPPSFSTWHPGAHCDVSYTLSFEMTRKGLRRHESYGQIQIPKLSNPLTQCFCRKIVPILYLPKTTPVDSPLAAMPRPCGNLLETPFPISDRVKTVKLSIDLPKETCSSSRLKHSVGSVYVSDINDREMHKQFT